MAGKKPVWVDEDAHTILKQYSKLTKLSMVDVASTLVLGKLSQLDPSSGLQAPAADGQAPALRAASPSVQKPVAVNKPQASKRRKPQRTMPDPNDADVRYVGGIWLV